jgi:hypothetical protein
MVSFYARFIRDFFRRAAALHDNVKGMLSDLTRKSISALNCKAAPLRNLD